MKSIKPVKVWVDGVVHNANELDLVSVHDNLESSATFFYTLSANKNSEVTKVASGNVVIGDVMYQEWGTADDINDEAYTICAEILNLEIL